MDTDPSGMDLSDVDPSDMDDMDVDCSDTDETICLGGDIRIEYHHSSGREHETLTFEEFIRPRVVPIDTPVDHKPWEPFRTREDFEFAELARDTGMTKAQTNALIGLFHRCIKNGTGSFTLSNYNEMHKTLKVAAERLPKVYCKFFSVFHMI